MQGRVLSTLKEPFLSLSRRDVNLAIKMHRSLCLLYFCTSQPEVSMILRSVYGKQRMDVKLLLSTYPWQTLSPWHASPALSHRDPHLLL